jgi:hypothetical protein
VLVLEIAAETVDRAETVAEAVRLVLGEPVSEGEAEVLADADEEGVAEPVVEDEPVVCREMTAGRRRGGGGGVRGLAGRSGKPWEMQCGWDSPME